MSVEKTKEKEVRFVDLSAFVRELYDELGITWNDIYIKARFSSRFKGVCIIAFAEDLNEIFVHCSGLLNNREKEIKALAEKALAEKLANNEDVDYDKIAIEIAKSLLSSDINHINVYDVSEYESAYLISIPH